MTVLKHYTFQIVEDESHSWNSKRKHMRSYPAVLIGRLGVHKDFRIIEGEKQRTGDQLMDFIKSWFIDGNNKTGWFIVVDAYNDERVIRYYTANGFIMLFSSEYQEKEYYTLDNSATLATRIYVFWFDFIESLIILLFWMAHIHCMSDIFVFITDN